jgi:hypothetical protein
MRSAELGPRSRVKTEQGAAEISLIRFAGDWVDVDRGIELNAGRRRPSAMPPL